jgi:hypothetical protein
MAAIVDNQRKLLIAAGIVIALLMGTIAMLIFNKMGDGKVIETQKKELSEADRLQKELTEEYDNAIAELDEALSENEDLRSIIETQKEELSERKGKISRMINSGNVSKKELNAAQAEISQLKSQQQAFLTKMDELEKTNSILSGEIVQVKEEKKMVEEEVAKVREEKDQVTAAKDSVINLVEGEKADLEKEKTFLASKVDLASIIKVNEMEVVGYKLKSGGKMVKKRYAKNVDVVKICYNATENRVTDPGTEQFLVRVMTPLGSTMYVESLGSSDFINKDTNEEMRYTKAQDVPYDNKSTTQCLNWKPDTPFAKGTYQIEVYNKGYLAGKSELYLK